MKTSLEVAEQMPQKPQKPSKTLSVGFKKFLQLKDQPSQNKIAIPP